jgi:hypothetical protein
MAGVFTQAFKERQGTLEQIVTFGDYFAVARALDATGALRYIREGGETGYNAGALRSGMRWTRWINALNQNRKWARERLFEKLDPLLKDGIAIAVVPSHDPFVDETPIRLLARRLAAGGVDRVDATGCLVRHTKIKRIVWGGPSYRGLHRQTISVVDAHLVQGRSVLLLDDIVRSGASLRACAEILAKAGAAFVQPVALGRVVRG